jgi:ribosomal protein S18 acetylase RimI-like enzyme
VQLSIRPAVAGDGDTVLALAVDTAMFAPDEAGGLRAAFNDAVRPGGELEGWAVADVEGGVVGAVHWGPEPFGDRVWNLWFIAVAPDRHGSGVGTALVGHVETHLRALGPDHARVLLVETSSTDRYDDARHFYLARGFVEEARIREFYGEGDDRVTFWKRTA